MILEGVSITGTDGVFNGSTTVTDATGSIGMFTRNQASFANDMLPSKEVDVIAILSQFNDYQVYIRNLDDLEE